MKKEESTAEATKVFEEGGQKTPEEAAEAPAKQDDPVQKELEAKKQEVIDVTVSDRS